MKQTIPFTKDITFKTKIGDLTSISLDNDLTLKGEDLIVGNFYIKGAYKLTKASSLTEEYSYKIPCEIAISDDYDTFDSTIDIDDFRYEIINDEILRVNIVVVIDNLVKKEKVEEEEVRCIEPEPIKLDIQEEKLEEIKFNENKEVGRDNLDLMNIALENKNNIVKLDKNEEKYLTYSVYLVREEDTLELIMNKYKVTKEELSDYNDIENFSAGMKLVIPSFLNND